MAKKKLYSAIYTALKQQILSGAYPPGIKIPGHKLLAQQYNVSSITSNRALQELEKEGLVKRHQRQGTFVSVNSQEICSIALFMPSLPEDHGSRLHAYITGCLERADHFGIRIHILNHLDVFKLSEIMKNIHVNGAICPLRAEPEVAQWFSSENKPLVVIGKQEPPGENFVSIDYRECSRSLVQTMINDGFKRIGFLGNLSFINHRNVRNGYLDAVAPLSLGQTLIRDIDDNLLPGAVHELLKTEIDALVVMGRNYPFKVVALPAFSKTKIQLGCFREAQEIDQLADIAYIADYSQIQAGNVAVDLLRDIYAGRISPPQCIHYNYNISYPGQKKEQKTGDLPPVD
jgi:DNA-binding transcriptional regulator YhcF (GntR family)